LEQQPAALSRDAATGWRFVESSLGLAAMPSGHEPRRLTLTPNLNRNLRLVIKIKIKIRIRSHRRFMGRESDSNELLLAAAGPPSKMYRPVHFIRGVVLDFSLV
jgi:hypothetical protein